VHDAVTTFFTSTIIITTLQPFCVAQRGRGVWQDWVGQGTFYQGIYLAGKQLDLDHWVVYRPFEVYD
jgi:hypothetical protein